MFLLVPAHPGFPGQIPQSRKTVVCVVCVCVCNRVLQSKRKFDYQMLLCKHSHLIFNVFGVKLRVNVAKMF